MTQNKYGISFFSNSQKLFHEFRRVSAMVELYCRRNHGSARDVCPECEDLISYAAERLRKCPYKDEKPSCRVCPIHCYQTQYRKNIREVMAFSGPLMMFYHPIVAIRHLWDEFKLRR